MGSSSFSGRWLHQRGGWLVGNIQQGYWLGLNWWLAFSLCAIWVFPAFAAGWRILAGEGVFFIVFLFLFGFLV